MRSPTSTTTALVQCLQVAVFLSFCSFTQAQNDAGWDTVLLDDSFAPLELRLGDLPNNEMAVMALWNISAGVNRIGAFRLAYPYDGSSFVFDSEIDTGALFGMGRSCAGTNLAVVPYVDNAAANVLNLRVATFNGATWSHALLAGGSEDFDSADCAVTSEGIFISAHSTTNSRINVYRSTNGGASFSLFDTITASGGIMGPSQGALRDSIDGLSDDPFLVFVYQRSDGMVVSQTYDTSMPRGLGRDATCDVFPFLAPTGTFDIVREGRTAINRLLTGGARVSSTFIGNLPGGGMLARGYITIDTIDTCNGIFPISLGAPDPFTPPDFQSPGLIPDPSFPGTNVLWGDYFLIDESAVAMGGDPLVHVQAENYPLESSGPRDGCYTFYGSYGRGAAADRREPLGTTFATRYMETSFSGSFEPVANLPSACNRGAGP